MPTEPVHALTCEGVLEGREVLARVYYTVERQGPQARADCDEVLCVEGCLRVEGLDGGENVVHDEGKGRAPASDLLQELREGLVGLHTALQSHERGDERSE